jgi:hypothetical protein
MMLTDKEMLLLKDLDARLVAVIKYAKQITNFIVIETHRSNERQEELFKAGKSKARAGESLHNRFPSLAFDAVPQPLDWNDIPSFARLNGIIQASAFACGVPIKLGADFSNIKDFPHYQLNIDKVVI